MVYLFATVKVRLFAGRLRHQRDDRPLSNRPHFISLVACRCVYSPGWSMSFVMDPADPEYLALLEEEARRHVGAAGHPCTLTPLYLGQWDYRVFEP